MPSNARTLRALAASLALSLATPAALAEVRTDQVSSDDFVRGAAEMNSIRQSVRTQRGLLLECYADALTSRPEIGGQVIVNLLIGPDGAVQTAAVESSEIDHEGMSECVAQAFLSMHFRPTAKGGMVLVRYPLLFTPEKAESPEFPEGAIDAHANTPTGPVDVVDPPASVEPPIPVVTEPLPAAAEPPPSVAQTEPPAAVEPPPPVALADSPATGGDPIPAPTPAPPTAVEAAPPPVDEAVTEQSVAQIIESNMPNLHGCYETALGNSPNLAGRVLVQFRIGADGSVVSAPIASASLSNADLYACLTETILNMRFPPLGMGEEELEVYVPLVFESVRVELPPGEVDGGQ